MDNDSTIVRENGRLRKELVGYQNALEAMELRAKHAEQSEKTLRKKLRKIFQVMQGIEVASE